MTTNFTDEIKETRQKLNQLCEAGNGAEEVESTDLEDLAKCPAGVTSSESYWLAAYGISEMLNDEDCDISMASAFIIHSITLKHVALSDRRLPLVKFDVDFEKQIGTFLATISNVFRRTVESKGWTKFAAERKLDNNTIDIIDGRVLRAVIQAMRENKIDSALSAAASKDWKMMCRIVMHLAEEELTTKGNTSIKSSATDVKMQDLNSMTESLAVLPFSHPVFDKHLECIHVDTDTSMPAKLGALKLYRETTHWHNYKKPLNPKYPVAVKVSKWK